VVTHCERCGESSVNISGVRKAVTLIWHVGSEDAVRKCEYRSCGISFDDDGPILERSSKNAICENNSGCLAVYKCPTAGVRVLEEVAVIDERG
jgi:hypothetical protein